MSADGYHSLFDGVTNIVELTGCFIASYPPDRDHPYGHQKYETLASFFVALLLICRLRNIPKRNQQITCPKQARDYNCKFSSDVWDNVY